MYTFHKCDTRWEWFTAGKLITAEILIFITVSVILATHRPETDLSLNICPTCSPLCCCVYDIWKNSWRNSLSFPFSSPKTHPRCSGPKTQRLLERDDREEGQRARVSGSRQRWIQAWRWRVSVFFLWQWLCKKWQFFHAYITWIQIKWKVLKI